VPPQIALTPKTPPSRGLSCVSLFVSLTQIEYAKNTDPIEQVAHDIPTAPTTPPARSAERTTKLRRTSRQLSGVSTKAAMRAKTLREKIQPIPEPRPTNAPLQLRHRSSRDQLLQHNKNQQQHTDHNLGPPAIQRAVEVDQRLNEAKDQDSHQSARDEPDTAGE
jgi:hypothetical protein